MGRSSSSLKQSKTQFKDSFNALEANNDKLEMQSHIKNLVEKKPSMQQKLNIVKAWFVVKAGGAHKAISVREAGEIILSKGLTSDIDSSIKTVYS